jgi:hypothetical protein
VGLSEDLVVQVQVVVHHAFGRETSFGVSACSAAVEAADLMHGRHGTSHIIRGHQEPTYANTARHESSVRMETIRSQGP